MGVALRCLAFTFQTLGMLSGFLVVVLLIRFRASLLASYRALLMMSFVWRPTGV